MLLVFDCTVLIDLREGDVLSHVKRLPHDLFICDVNADELCKRSKKRWPRFLRESRIQKKELPPKEMPVVLRLSENYQRPSRKDLFSLALAIQLGATLVTGDSDLRQAGESEGCPVHGTLWLLDEMVGRRALEGTQAVAALEKMRRGDRRIPSGLADQYREAWQRGKPFSFRKTVS